MACMSAWPAVLPIHSQVKGFKALDSVRGCSPHRPARASAQQRSVFRLSVSRGQPLVGYVL